MDFLWTPSLLSAQAGVYYGLFLQARLHKGTYHYVLLVRTCRHSAPTYVSENPPIHKGSHVVFALFVLESLFLNICQRLSFFKYVVRYVFGTIIQQYVELICLIMKS